ncbi:hypothetical protein UDIV_6770 [Ureaplasma diversum NCTC 246]|uniref:Uncharacterized protein n=1 Tax=Ureaplasma diversum NCTC 246 TaxID=1188241 RepID=A0A084EWC0_9BACT|nr:hypothetical protein UDIV_6770 [Ureaplasma diversum NCTC 246]
MKTKTHLQKVLLKKSLLEENIKITDPTVVKQTQPLVALEPAKPIQILLNNIDKNLKLVDNKYALNFKLDASYINKYVQIQLQKADDQDVLITSNKTKIANDGSVQVSFENLEDNNEYLINKIFIYENNNSNKDLNHQISNPKDDLSVFTKLSDIQLEANSQLTEYYYEEFKIKLNNLLKWKNKELVLVVENQKTKERFESLRSKIENINQDFFFLYLYSVYDQYKIVELKYFNEEYKDKKDNKDEYISIPLSDEIKNQIFTVKYKTNLKANPFTNEKDKERLYVLNGLKYLSNDNKTFYFYYSDRADILDQNTKKNIIKYVSETTPVEEYNKKFFIIKSKEELLSTFKSGALDIDNVVTTNFDKKNLLVLLFKDYTSGYFRPEYRIKVPKRVDINSQTKTINVELEENNEAPWFKTKKDVSKRSNTIPTANFQNYPIFLLEVDKIDNLSEYNLKFDFKDKEKDETIEWDSLPWNE